MLINIGDAHIFVTLLPADAEDLNKPFHTLQLKYICGAKQGQRDDFNFSISDMENG